MYLTNSIGNVVGLMYNLISKRKFNFIAKMLENLNNNNFNGNILTYKKYSSELLATLLFFDAKSFKYVMFAFDIESTQLSVHSDRHCDHGNTDANEAKK